MNRLIGLLLLLVCIGCAATPDRPAVVPVPTDIGWSAPTAAPDDQPSPRPPPRAPGKAEKLIPYVAGDWMKVDVPVGAPLLLEFHADESVVQRAFVQPDEERKPWEVRIGEPGTPRSVITVVATEPNLPLQLIVTTTKRIYLLTLHSRVKSPVAVVRWDHPPEPVVAKPRLLPDPTRPQAYHAGYTWEANGSPPTWMPRQVVDDGRRTYIVLPVNLSVMHAPMVRLIGPNGPEVTNPVLKDSVIVLDQMIPYAAELRMGIGPAAEVVKVTRGLPQRIECPGDPACPMWSERVAGR